MFQFLDSQILFMKGGKSNNEMQQTVTIFRCFSVNSSNYQIELLGISSVSTTAYFLP